MAMRAMLQRGLRNAGQFPPPGAAATIAGSLNHVTWITSLVEWLAEMRVGIRVTGNAPPLGNPSIAEMVGERDHVKRELASLRGVGCLGEIHMVGDLQPPLPGMEWVVGHPPVPLICVEVRVGQVWLFANRRD